MEIVTGYVGEPHITAQQDRDTNIGIFGEDSYILATGNQLSGSVMSANEIRIRDGAVSHQGCIGVIQAGAYDNVTISNGTQGMQRIDLIVVRYEKDPDTNAESLELAVIEGTPVASGVVPVPDYNTGSIRLGDSPVDMPLFQVFIFGVNIQSVTKVAKVLQTLNGVDDYHAVKTITEIGNVTASSGITINTVSIFKNEYMAQCYVSFTHTAAWTANTAYDVGTLAEGFRPRTTVIGKTTGTPDVNGSININGLINCVPRANRAANTREYVSFPLYFLQD